MRPSAHAFDMAVQGRRLSVLEMPDVQTANAFVTGSVDKLTQCIVRFELLQTVASTVADAASPIVSLQASLPAQIMSLAALITGIALLTYGYKLLRPVNFVAGAYFGGTTALMMLNIFVPALSSCLIIVLAASVSGLLLGVLCSLKRVSVLVVLGLVVGEIIGDLFYKTFLAAVAPEYIAFGCIGFFAVLAGVLAGHAGDFAWKLCCSFFGAFLVISSVLRLVIVPFVPDAIQFESFLAFKPDVPHKMLQRASEHHSTLFGSPYVFGPVLALLLLTAAGTWLQLRLLKEEQSKDML